jgi:hypothetical protein
MRDGQNHVRGTCGREILCTRQKNQSGSFWHETECAEAEQCSWGVGGMRPATPNKGDTQRRLSPFSSPKKGEWRQQHWPYNKTTSMDGLTRADAAPLHDLEPEIACMPYEVMRERYIQAMRLAWRSILAQNGVPLGDAFDEH